MPPRASSWWDGITNGGFSGFQDHLQAWKILHGNEEEPQWSIDSTEQTYLTYFTIELTNNFSLIELLLLHIFRQVIFGEENCR